MSDSIKQYRHLCQILIVIKGKECFPFFSRTQDETKEKYVRSFLIRLYFKFIDKLSEHHPLIVAWDTE